MVLPTRLLGLAFAMLGSIVPVSNLSAVGLPSSAMPITHSEPPLAKSPIDLRRRADEAASHQNWEAALDLYLKLYVNGQPTLELKERIKQCLRHAAQIRRHQDPAFQQFVISLTVADALNLYVEVIEKISTLHVDRNRATPANLFTLGLDAFDQALGRPEFRRQLFGSASDSQINDYRQAVRNYSSLRPPTNPREARAAVREVVAEAQRRLGTHAASSIVCEFLTGACSGIDEFTHYDAPETEAIPAEAAMPTVVDADMVASKEGVGYLRIVSFRDTTAREIDESMISLQARGLRALLIDLRGNPGGSFPAAVQVAERFLARGVIVTTDGEAAEFSNRVFSSNGELTAYEVPIVLLVDTKTMSSAEVVAAAWKANHRAVLVGSPTFGKGVLQTPIRLRALDRVNTPPGTRSGVLVLTVANLYDPLGFPLQGLGITPHLLVTDATRQYEVAIEKAIELVSLPMPMPMP